MLRDVKAKKLLTATPSDPQEKTVNDMFSYVKTCFGLGGMQMQMNVVTSAMLRHVRADKTGVDDPFRREKSMTTWTDPARLKRCRDAFMNGGCCSRRLKRIR